MKITIEFDSVEDAEEYKLAYHASEMHNTIFEFDQWLRGLLKH